MFESKLWLLVGIFIAIVVTLILFLTMKISKKRGYRPDFYAYFVMGIIWFPVGLAADNTVFWVLGLIFATVGLINRDKWKTNRMHWGKVDSETKKLFFAIIVLLTIMIIAGIIVFVLMNQGIL